MLENLKLVIFDMDGLMLDTEIQYVNAFKETFERKNIKVNMDVYIKVIGTYDPIDMDSFNQSDLPNEEISKIFDDAYYDAIDKMLENGVPAKKGLYELLDYLEEKQIKKVVATSTPFHISGKLLEKAGILDRFEFVITSKEVKHGKPAPDIFLEACKRMNVDVNEALVLEDSLNGGLAAKNANIAYIIIPDIKQPTKEIADSAYAVKESLLDVIDCLNKV